MQRRWIAGLLAAYILLAGCGSGSAPGQSSPPAASLSAGSSLTEEDTPAAGYQPPPMADAAFDPAAATGGSDCLLDTSHLSEGYVAVSARSAKRLKFQVVFGDVKYNYDLPGDGTPIVCPLQSGSGSYTFRVMENVADTQYTEKYARTEQVQLASEFEPFLRPSCYVHYAADDDCVALARDLAASAENEAGAVAAVYDSIVKHIKYDTPKAESIGTGYLSDADETLATGKGICIDYAVLAAAMLRSQGIPTKVITGYVAPNDLYHAWNMIWLEETGWITVEFEVKPGVWNRVDTTFAAGGAGSQYIGDGSNYTDFRTY